MQEHAGTFSLDIIHEELNFDYLYIYVFGLFTSLFNLHNMHDLIYHVFVLKWGWYLSGNYNLLILKCEDVTMTFMH